MEWKTKGIRLRAGFDFQKRRQSKQINEKITFDQIAGNNAAVTSLQTVVRYLKDPAAFQRIGAQMPRGILFYGPPGTGKTLMARALAGEADVPFLEANGADFVQMYVGVGASRIRSLFRKARRYGKAVLFIDELDALGRSRSQQADNAERDQTLGALLGEMSGFKGQSGILVIGATNRREMLDEALLRPGRFDRQFFIGLPDEQTREKILALKTKHRPMETLDLTLWSKKTLGFSGAGLETLCNEAALLAAEDGCGKISSQHMEKAWRNALCGEETSALQGRDKRKVAFHEAGHALISAILLPDDIVDHVTILPHSRGSGGHILRIPKERMPTREELYAQIQMLLGGRAAEELIYGEEGVTSGAANDIEKATALLQEMLFHWGMDDEIGPVRLPAEHAKLSARMSLLYEDSLALLRDRKDTLLALANALVKEETISGERFRQIVHDFSEAE